MRRLALVLAAVAVLTVANPVLATPITYTVTATATGTLGASAFTNAFVTITLTSDTSTVSGSPVQTNFGIATVNVSGLGTATFTSPLLWAFVNPTLPIPAAGISDVTLGRLILDTMDPVFAAYDLRTSIGPVSGTAGFNPGFLLPTTSGNFALTSIAGGTSTFTAVTSAVPEPVSVILVGTGVIGIVSVSVKRRRHRLNHQQF